MIPTTIVLFSKDGNRVVVNESDAVEWLAKGWTQEKPAICTCGKRSFECECECQKKAAPVSEPQPDASPAPEAKPKAEGKPENKKPKK